MSGLQLEGRRILVFGQKPKLRKVQGSVFRA